MAITKEKVVDKIEVVENGAVQIRERTDIIEDGALLSSTFHRRIIAPGESYTDEDARVVAICKAVHTKAVVDAYATMLENIGV